MLPFVKMKQVEIPRFTAKIIIVTDAEMRIDISDLVDSPGMCYGVVASFPKQKRLFRKYGMWSLEQESIYIIRHQPLESIEVKPLKNIDNIIPHRFSYDVVSNIMFLDRQKRKLHLNFSYFPDKLKGCQIIFGFYTKHLEVTK